MALGCPLSSLPMTSASGRLAVYPYSLWHMRCVADGEISTSLATSANETPFQGVSNFDHLVTQWMSTVTSTEGSASTSDHDSVTGCATSPVIRKSQVERSPYSGTLPAWSTGKRSVKYCPGGSR